MINNNGLIGNQPRRITFNESIKQSMPIDKLMQSFLGCAVVYKGEDTYINKVKMNDRYNNYFRHADMFLFELDNGEKPTTNVDLKLYKSDLNDDLESVIDRMNSVEHEYNLYNPVETINITRKFDVNYDINDLNNLPKEIKGNIVDVKIKKGYEDFTSIFNSLHKVSVEYKNKPESTLGVRTLVTDISYQPNSQIDYIGNQINLEYSDIKVILAGVSGTHAITSPNITFFYNHKPLSFKELLEKHNNGEIK